MADKSIVSNSKLTAIANAIRSKTGTTASLTLDAMVSEIANISTGTSPSDATATPDDILLGKTAYVNGKKITGTIETYDGTNDGVIADRFKKLLDNTKSCANLFYGYTDTSVDDLISYSDTENVTNMSNMFFNCVNLQTIPELNTSKVTNMNSMFFNCYKLQTVPQLNTSNVTTMNNMFYGCKTIQTIPQLDTSNVTNMGQMFFDCSKLQTIPNLDTSNVIAMDNMFRGCSTLHTVPQLDTSNATKIYFMFRYCYKLQTIDITSMDKITSTSNSSYMCHNCSSLTKLIIRTMTVIPALDSNAFTNCYHFTGTKNSTYNPDGLKDGRIYVPDNMVDSLKTATNWSTYADIIVPLSSLED